MTKEIRQNLVIYSLFLLIALASIFYGNSIRDQHSFLRVWSYSNLLILLLGVPFLFVQMKAGLPNFLQPGISNKSRFLQPAIIGVVFGVLDIIVIKVLMHPEPYTTMPPFLQPFPYSLFLYVSGAFEVEVFYRLVPLTLILLLGKWYKNGRHYTAFFWVGAVLTAVREPLEQLPEGNVGLILYSLATGFAMNFLQAVWYRKAGFLASLSMRLGHYLFWHILLGIYVEYFELSK
jgi:hypothetical protein